MEINDWIFFQAMMEVYRADCEKKGNDSNLAFLKLWRERYEKQIEKLEAEK